MPYVIGLGMDVVLNLHEEYKAIMDMFEADNVTYPIKAFFGELLERPRRTKAYPIALINKNINLDQLLAINNAMKYPLAYIQGPPGTGKTNTIINTIVTAFFNNVTVLFASYNNVPIDNVFEKLSSMKYRGKTIPFPVLRLGNTEKVMEAIKYINELRTQVQSLQIFASTLDKRKDDRIDRAKRLSARLKEYEEILDLKERKETLTHLMKYQEHMKNTMKLLPFQTDLQGYQMQKLDKRIAAIGETGTAENIGEDHSVFICFAPMNKPKIAVAVYIENARGGGGTWAAPIASLIIEKYLKGEVERKDMEKTYMETNPCQSLPLVRKIKPKKVHKHN